ncbi:MAG: hypothetical protein ACI35O_10000 [Bacillaceae bacterium]
MKYVLYPLFLAGILFLQGCSYIPQPINTIKKPNLTIEQKKTLDDIKEELPSGAEIIQVSTENSSQKFHYQDLDKDNQEELIVFYTEKNKPSEVKMAILEEKKTTYHLKQELKLPDQSIKRVDFTDLDKDGTKEILLHFSYTPIKAEEKNLFIYSADKQGFYQRMNIKTYYDASIIPYNDSYVLLFVSKKENETLITLSTYEDKKIKDCYQLTLPFHIFEIRNMKYGNISKQEVGLTIDFIAEEEQLKIMMLQIEDYTLKQIQKPLISEATFLGNSADYNGDSIIDIPVSETVYTYDGHYIGITYFYNWDGNNDFKLSWSSYVNTTIGYTIIIPNIYEKTIKITETENIITAINKETGNELFTIFKVNNENMVKELAIHSKTQPQLIKIDKDYHILGKKKDNVYVVQKKDGFFEKGFQFIPYLQF